jgi:hypothetical protein
VHSDLMSKPVLFAANGEDTLVWHASDGDLFGAVTI